MHLFLLVSQADGDRKKHKGKEPLEQSSIHSKLATLQVLQKHNQLDFTTVSVIVNLMTLSWQLYNRELESEFGHFNDWMNTFELHRGKANEEDGEGIFVGKFKVGEIELL